MRTDPCFLVFLLLSCSKESPPSVTPEPSTSPVPVTTASLSLPASAAAPASAPASASASASSQSDPIALALAPTDAALRKSAKGPPHPAPFITAAEGRVTGDANRGWTVTWSRRRPAGWEIEAGATVSPTKQVKVTKAEAVFSPD